MSQIQVHAQHAGQPIQVVFGWDRPLQSCFLNIVLSDEQVDDPKFETLSEAAVNAFAARSLAVEDVAALLDSAGLTIPMRALTELTQHAEDNVGNVIVSFDAAGNRSVLVS